MAQPESWDLVASAYAAEAVPTVFAHFAAAALRLAGLPEGARVADVACGPGTLSLLAAPRAARVAALDFSAAMIAELRAVAPPNVEAQVGDGQELPWPDASFDRAFSLFGLIFFPDRARGFRELARVLAPGGRAVVSSWPPPDRAPIIAALFRALGGAAGVPPLTSPDALVAEMTAGGFEAVEVHEETHSLRIESMAALWDTVLRTNVAVALTKRNLGERWETEGPAIRARLEAEIGPGPYTLTMPALLAVGTKP